MVQRFIETPEGLDSLLRFLQREERPFTVSISRGGARTGKQNRLFHLWIGEIQQQKQDESHEYWRGYCKLPWACRCSAMSMTRSAWPTTRRSSRCRTKPRSAA